MAYVAVSAVTGLTVAFQSQGGTASDYCAIRGYGTYTAADFYLDYSNGPGFSPSKVVVTNLTDGTMGVWWLSGTGLTKVGYTQVAAGDKTLVAAASIGVAYSDGHLNVDVSDCCPITTNDDFLIECYR